MTPRTADRLEERRRQHPYDRLSARAQRWTRCVVGVVVGLLLAWIGEELMPGDEAAKRVFARGYLPYMTAIENSPVASLMPQALVDRLSYPDTGQKQVTVLSIDDRDLDAWGFRWPMNLGAHAMLLDYLREGKARAIFLDILLLDPRQEGEVSALTKAACAARAQGIPVFLASIPKLAVAGSPEKKLEEATVPINGTATPCVKLVSPFTSEDQFDRATWEYPLCARGLPSAALALACAAQRSPGDRCPWQETLDRCHATAAKDDARTASVPDSEQAPVEDNATEMALVWPSRGSQRNGDLLRGKDGKPLCRGHLAHGKYLLPVAALLPDEWPVQTRAVWLKIFQDSINPKAAALCPYSDLLPMRSYLNIGYDAKERAPLMAGRLVLIGANFVGHSDRHFAPLHEEVSGVQVHAMALDNLLSHGERWLRASKFEPLDWTSPDNWRGNWFALTAVLLVVLGWELQEVLRDAARRREHPLWSPWSDWLFGARPWMPRWLTAGKNLALTLLSLGRLPARRRGKLPGLALIAFIVLTVTLWCTLIGLLFFLANKVFLVGPLSQLEYVVVPLALGLIDPAHRLARSAVLLWAATQHGHDARPAQYVRDHRELRPDQAREREIQSHSHLTLPPADAAASLEDPAPAPPRTPP